MGNAPHRAAGFFRQRQKGFTLGRAESWPRLLAQKKDHKSEYEAETDREGEWNDGHKHGIERAGTLR